MSNKQLEFKFRGHTIPKASIDVKDISNISKELNINFKTSSTINNDDIFIYGVVIEISDVNKNVEIEVHAYGHFEFDKEADERKKEVFFNTSAPAMLFPYVRAYISTLTALSGINPIILPTINLTTGAVKK